MKKPDSAVKRDRKAEKRRIYNKSQKSEIKTRMKKCGGNVGDDVHIPLPHWVTEIGQKNPDIYFTNKEGKRNTECLTWGIDKGRVLRGRTAVESKNSGLATWEPAGAAEWLEALLISIPTGYSLFFFLMLNPTEFFADIVVEHEYVECTSSAIQAIVLFKKL
ncbi:hypothetical protein ACFX1X_047454 [Malus domestica]